MSRILVAAILLVVSLSLAEVSAQTAPKANAVELVVIKNVSNKTSTTQAEPAERGSCQIGVIPIAGNLFLVEKFGLFKFNDTYARVGVDGWALDDLIVSRVRAAEPGSSVRRIPFTREELAHYRSARSLFLSGGGNVKEFAQYVASRINCERYVVVHRHGSGQREYGIGISNHTLDERVYLFAMMYVRVYDGRTFELIKQGPASISDESLIARAYINPVGGPYRELDPAAFPGKPTDAARNPILRDGVRTLLTASLDKTLPALLERSSKASSH